MSGYRGDLGDHKDDFRILIYDPNRKGMIRNYHAQMPPHLPLPSWPADDLVHALVFEFRTGADDLRGGSDNVDLTVNLADGSQDIYRNINLGARWIGDSTECAEVPLRRPFRQDDLRSLVISTTFGGGVGGENWNMSALTVYALGSGFFTQLKAGIGPKRFTGTDKVLSVTINPLIPEWGQLDRLVFTFRTGNDDLRGGNDNVNLTIQFRDGTHATDRKRERQSAMGGQHDPHRHRTAELRRRAVSSTILLC